MIYLVSHIRPARETGHCTFFAQEDFHGEVIIVGCLNVTLFQVKLPPEPRGQN